MISAIGPFNTGNASGGAGVATANATGTIAITGKLLGFYLKHNDSPPAGTTDVTIEAVSGALPTRTLLAITNAATDGFIAVRQPAVNTSNAAITNSFVEQPLVGDKIKVTIAQANDNDNVDVWAIVER